MSMEDVSDPGKDETTPSIDKSNGGGESKSIECGCEMRGEVTLMRWLCMLSSSPTFFFGKGCMRMSVIISLSRLLWL